MEVRIEEGRLVETGSERRAFGEFVGPHGELASYAFGWAAGADTRLTIGIPAGTFHAGVSADELWQLIGTTDGGPEGRIAHLHHVVDHDPTLLDVLDLAPGQSALREHPGGPWTRGDEPPDPAG